MTRSLSIALVTLSIALALALAQPGLARAAAVDASVQSGSTVPDESAVRGDPAGPATAPTAGAVGASGAPATQPGLPARAPQARTLRAHWHVFIAFAVTWVLLFGYALSIGRRFARLEEEVRRMGGDPA